MKEIYMDQAWGIRKPSITKTPYHPEKVFTYLDIQIRKLLNLSSNDFLSFSQNATTSLIYALLPILKNQDYKIHVSSHEIRWFEKLFSNGKLPPDSTYPNYNKLKNTSFIKKPFQVFEPSDLLTNPGEVLGSEPCIVILSHVSRITGEIFASQKIYSAIKKLNEDNIVVVDGCQAVGALVTQPKKLSDIYLGVSSKFIGAEPHLGFCWIRKEIANRFDIAPWSVDPNNFSKEIYSASQALKKLAINPKKILSIRKTFAALLRENEMKMVTGKNQAPHIVIIPTKKDPVKVAKGILNKGYVISRNTGWSITEPAIPGIRISLTTKTSVAQIKKLAGILSSMKKGDLL